MAGKKSFTNNNPALAYITQEEETPTKSKGKEQEEVKPIESKEQEATQPTTTKGNISRDYKIFYVEKRNQRVQILLPASIVKRVKAIAKKKKVSNNEIYNMAIYKFLSEEEK